MRLVLIKHAMPVVTDGVTASAWPLSDEGREAALALAVPMADQGLARVLTSDEPKAAETGRILAGALGVPCATWPDLHEHDRSNVSRLESPEAFRARARMLFERPGELVWGRETADAARARFERALQAALDAHHGENLAVVSHGTVITLWLAARFGWSPFYVWKSLGLPSFAVLEGPPWQVLERGP
jgi:broad specificity phosphatase PhoE